MRMPTREASDAAEWLLHYNGWLAIDCSLCCLLAFSGRHVCGCTSCIFLSLAMAQLVKLVRLHLMLLSNQLPMHALTDVRLAHASTQ